MSAVAGELSGLLSMIKTVSEKPARKKAPQEIHSKADLIAFLSRHSNVRIEDVKSVLASLDEAITSSIHKKNMGRFTLPGLLKITTQQVPSKPKRTRKDNLTGELREFAAKPAYIRVKLRALKKLKDATG